MGLRDRIQGAMVGAVQRSAIAREMVGAVVVDSWTNLLTNMGRLGLDKRLSSEFIARDPLDRATLEALFEQDDLARKIVSRHTEELIREWVDIKVECGEDDEADAMDADDLAADELERLNALGAIEDLLDWARLYGGSILIVGAIDGQPFDQPINWDAIQEIRYLQVVDRWHCTPEEVEYDSSSPAFGLPMFYRLTGGNGDVRIHHSRVIRADGAKVTPEKLRQNWWHDSVLEVVFNVIRDYASGMAGMGSALHDYSVTVLGMHGLKNALASGKSQVILDRAAAAHATMSMFRMMVHDADAESVQRMAHNLAGMPDAIDKLLDRVASAADMPKAILFGNAIGKVSGADNDLRVYYDRAAYRQRKQLVPVVKKILQFVFAAKKGPFAGVEPDGWSVHPCPLYRLSEQEAADVRLKNAQADQIEIDSGVLAPWEVRISRHGNDNSTTGITLDPEVSAQLKLDKVPKPPPPAPTPALPPVHMPPGMTPPALPSPGAE